MVMIKNSIWKKIMVVAAAIAAVSTIPYGYHFAGVLFLPETYFYLILGVIFATTSYLANLLLGAYSLFNVKEKASKKRIFLTATLGFLGAIPMGFMGFYAYRQLLPLTINLISSFTVVFVNSGINYTAVKNLLNNAQQLKKTRGLANKATAVSRLLVCATGFVIGLLVSVTMYLATSNGIATIAKSQGLSDQQALGIAFSLAIITWLPLAALYSNANQTVLGWLYDFFKPWRGIKKLSVYKLLLLLGVILSGTALAQMVLEFYNPSHYIPEFFKAPFIQYLSKNILMPLTLLSSAAVNYFALSHIFFKTKAHERG